MKQKPFFSEEKNQKTFAPTPAGTSGPYLKRNAGINPLLTTRV
jgi:hypothetical protein